MRVLEKPFLKVTLIRGLSGKSAKVRSVLESLGLKRLNQVYYYRNTPALVGQINKVIQFVRVEEVDKV